MKKGPSPQETRMKPAPSTADSVPEQDVADSLLPYVPWALPLAGAALIFMLISIAISVA